MNTTVVVAILSCQVAAAGAATVASTFGPSNSYSTSTAAYIGLTPGGGVLQQAFPFSVPSASSYFLDGIEVPVSAQSPESTTIIFDLMADSSGLPGPVLESFTFSGITTAFSGEVVSGQSSLRPTLLAGETYWLAASAPQATLYWNVAPGYSVLSATRRDFGPWVLSDEADTGSAFRISGTPVPEPLLSSLIFVGTLVLALLRGRVHKRSGNG